VTGATGVTVTLSGAASKVTSTDPSGNYTFAGLSNGSYTVTASLPGYTFAPVSNPVQVNGANVASMNFTASLKTYAIMGTVSDPSGMNPVPGVTLTLTGPSGGTATTDGGGHYTINGLAGIYTVTPSKAGYTFTPPSRQVTLADGVDNSAVDFTAAVATAAISGTITGATGVTVTLSGASSATTTTDASGGYTFAGLPNGPYTVTPSKAGYVFAPTSAPVTMTGSNVTQNFVATLLTYAISGSVKDSTNAPIAGVTVALSAPASMTTTTDASGNYTFAAVPNGSYTLTASMALWTIAPTSTPVTVNGANVPNQNFTGWWRGNWDALVWDQDPWQ
jgi:hypothetical protein